MSPDQPKSEISLGRIAGHFGVRGELKLEPTRAGTDALAPGLAVHVAVNDRRIPATLATVRAHQARYLLAFDGIASRDAASAFIGGTVLVDRDLVPVRDGEYLDADLVGALLVDEAGTELGDVRDVLHYPSQDMLVVGPRRAMVPLVREFIKDVDLATKRIRVTLPAGLLDLSDAEEG